MPTHYDVYWHPDLETGNFTGQEKISITVVEATSQIVLHAHLLEITSVFTYTNNLQVESYELDEERQFLIVNLSTELAENATFTLGILFNGQMKDKLVGLYSSTYQNEAGNQR